MGKRYPLIGSLFLCLTILLGNTATLQVFAVPALADDDQQTDFDAALKAAEANRKTDRGSMYDAAFTLKAGPWLANAMYRCSRNLSRADYRPVIILVRVSTEGTAEEVLARPLTKVARCLKARFASAKHPKPPGASWWVKMDIRVR